MNRSDESRLRMLEAEAHKELLPLTQPSATATAAGVVASAPPPPNGRSTKGLMELMEEEQLSDFIPGLGMFLFRRDKHSRKRRAEFLQLGRSQKAKIVKLTYEIIENVCAKVCPGGQGDLLDSIARIHKTYRRRRLSNMALQQGLSASSPSSASSQGLLSAIDEELGGGGGPGVDASTAMGAEHLMHGMHMGGGGGSLGLPRHPGMGEGVTSTMRTAAGLMDLARRNQMPMNHLGGMGPYAATPANPAVRAAFGQPSNNYYDNVAAKGAAFSQRSGLGSSVLPGGFPVDAMSGTHHHLPQQQQQQQQAAHEPTPAYRHPFETELGAQNAWQVRAQVPARAPAAAPAISEEALILSNLWRSAANMAPNPKHQDSAFATMALGQKGMGEPAARPSLAV